MFGGGGGIRTLERLSAVIRFPIVRARPGYATPPNHNIYFLFIILHIFQKYASDFQSRALGRTRRLLRVTCLFFVFLCCCSFTSSLRSASTLPRCVLLVRASLLARFFVAYCQYAPRCSLTRLGLRKKTCVPLILL